MEEIRKWKVWFIRFDDDGKVVGKGMLNEYAYKSSARRFAKKFENKPLFKIYISINNPFIDESIGKRL